MSCPYGKKIERDPRQPNLIQTVRNVGYRFNLTGAESSPEQSATQDFQEAYKANSHSLNGLNPTNPLSVSGNGKRGVVPQSSTVGHSVRG